MKVVIASNNKGKIRELTELLTNLPLTLIPQSQLGVDEIEETATTFIENALLKARHAAHRTGLAAIADDSGLAVSALQGAPGIYSARYAGAKATAEENIQKLLHDLKHVPAGERQAYFHCVLVFMANANDPTPIVCDGKWSGVILPPPRGQQGFGYDPIFYLPSLKKTAAELPLAIKNKISHRGIALQSLKKMLAEQYP